MTREIIFENPGVIDKRSIITFGINAKVNDHPIGQFGTGLKYAIAILLRTGHRITIWAGTEKLSFSAREEHIRGKTYERVYMNDMPLGFTTAMGQTWELWQAFRELYANTVDEQGTVWERIGTEYGHKTSHGEDGFTLVCVEGDEFAKQYDCRSEFVLEGEPLFTIPNLVEVYTGENTGVFYRGFKVNRWDKKSQYTYNILQHLDLTEDRTAKYAWQVDDIIMHAVLKAPGPEFVKRTIAAPAGTFENSLRGYSSRISWSAPSATFIDSVAELKKEGTELSKDVEDAYAEVRPEDQLKVIASEQLDDELHEGFKDVRSFLSNVWFTIDHSIVFVEDLQDATHVTRIKDKIYIARAAFRDLTIPEVARLVVCAHSEVSNKEATRVMWDLLTAMQKRYAEQYSRAREAEDALSREEYPDTTGK